MKTEPAAAQRPEFIAANARHVELIRRLALRAEASDLPLWLTGGWAVDARLGRMTRVHSAIGLAFPGERASEFDHLLQGLAAAQRVARAHGFSVRVEGVQLECEPCTGRHGAYGLDGAPAGACPEIMEGRVGGTPVRCASWQAILWRHFHGLHGQPAAAERAAYAIARDAVGAAQADTWLAMFRAQRAAGV
jgi:2''-aminoglycoside nucleotidyltransferase